MSNKSIESDLSFSSQDISEQKNNFIENLNPGAMKFLMRDDKMFLAVSFLANEFGYAADYLSRLARQNKVQACYEDGLWYVTRESLVQHQEQAKQNKIYGGLKSVRSGNENHDSFDHAGKYSLKVGAKSFLQAIFITTAFLILLPVVVSLILTTNSYPIPTQTVADNSSVIKDNIILPFKKAAADIGTLGQFGLRPVRIAGIFPLLPDWHKTVAGIFSFLPDRSIGLANLLIDFKNTLLAPFKNLADPGVDLSQQLLFPRGRINKITPVSLARESSQPLPPSLAVESYGGQSPSSQSPKPIYIAAPVDQNFVRKLVKQFFNEEKPAPVPFDLISIQGSVNDLNQKLTDLTSRVNQIPPPLQYSSGRSGTTTVGSNNAELEGSKLTISDTKITGSSVTTSSLAVSGTTKFNTITYTWPLADGSADQRLSTNGSGTLSWVAATSGSVASNSLDFDEFVNTMLLDANLTINRGGFKIGIGAAPSTVLEVQGTASASYFLTGNTIQVGGFASVAYNRFGTTATTHANYISTTNDLLISGDMETRGTVSFGGNASISGTLNVGTVSGLDVLTLKPGTTDEQVVIQGSNRGSAGTVIGSTVNNTQTSGDGSTLRLNQTFAVSSGTATYTGLDVGITINQTSTASGITRGIFINPTLTAIKDWRALEIDGAGGYGIYQAAAAAKNYFNGTVGIGTTAPKGSKLFMVETASGVAASSSFTIRSALTVGNIASISATSLTSGNVLQLTVPASTSGGGAYLLVRDTDGNVYASLSSGGRFSIRRTFFSRGASTTNCTGVGAPSAGCIDYAENFPTSDNTITAGDVVSIDSGDQHDGLAVIKSSKIYDSLIMGVVSTNPAVLITGNNVKLGDEANNFKEEGMVPVALAGRVPVKISFENGDIKKGDYLTSSSTPGKAMKATKPGRVIGIALESQKTNQATVMVLINPHWAGQELDVSGQLADFSGLSSILGSNANIIAAVLEYLKDAVLRVRELVADVITTQKLNTQKICVGQTCITEEQLKELLQNVRLPVNPIQPNASPELSPFQSPTLTPIPIPLPSDSSESSVPTESATTPQPSPSPTLETSDGNAEASAGTAETDSTSTSAMSSVPNGSPQADSTPSIDSGQASTSAVSSSPRGSLPRGSVPNGSPQATLEPTPEIPDNPPSPSVEP